MGTENEYIQTFGNKPLVSLVAGLVGLEQEAANQLFSDFINDHSLNSRQMEFVHLIVKHVVDNGTLDKTIFNDHPFNKYGSVTHLFEGKISTVTEIVKRIDGLNNRLMVG
ncbi:MAG: hypothetical protein HQK62_15315 [Desulfamplus sp.]|nr:hypothetical protein [Desulfamplus sp.]